MNLKSNAKAVWNKKTALDLAFAMLGSGVYMAVPTLAKLNGTPGALTGLGSSLALSTLLGKPQIALGGAVVFLTHATYVFVNPKIYAATGTALFGWSEDSYTVMQGQLPASTAAAASAATAAGGKLNDAPRQYRLPNGQTVVGYSGGEGGINDKLLIGAGRNVTLEDKPTVGKGASLRLDFSRPKRA